LSQPISYESTNTLSPDPSNIFATPSPLVAAWIQYFKNTVQFLRYDSALRLYLFYDPDGRSKQLIEEYSLGDPSVNMRRFMKTYKNVLAEKQRGDGAIKAARRAVRRG